MTLNFQSKMFGTDTAIGTHSELVSLCLCSVIWRKKTYFTKGKHDFIVVKIEEDS